MMLGIFAVTRNLPGGGWVMDEWHDHAICLEVDEWHDQQPVEDGCVDEWRDPQQTRFGKAAHSWQEAAAAAAAASVQKYATAHSYPFAAFLACLGSLEHGNFHRWSFCLSLAIPGSQLPVLALSAPAFTVLPGVIKDSRQVGFVSSHLMVKGSECPWTGGCRCWHGTVVHGINISPYLTSPAMALTWH
eukprot:255675-Pelagomonas_calceolata.AAC.3